MNVKVMTTGKLALTCSAIAMSAGLGSAVADQADLDYAVAYISDAAHGDLVRNMDYEVAIENLQGTELDGIDGFYAATNLCVAYLKTDQVQEARTTCDDAVSRIVNEIETTDGAESDTEIGNTYRGYLAQALSNRGVAFAASGELELARTDFQAAIIARSTMHAAVTNLARLEDSDPAAF